MNFKHQPLLHKQLHVHVNNTRKHSNQQHCSEQLQSRVWTISLIVETFPYIVGAYRVYISFLTCIAYFQIARINITLGNVTTTCVVINSIILTISL